MKIIALDIGGTAVKSGLVDNGVLKEHRETPVSYTHLTLPTN